MGCGNGLSYSILTGAGAGLQNWARAALCALYRCKFDEPILKVVW